ncbi:MAG: imidazole glycerol phosphate synthase subunit HisH [Bacteroidota bacterium]
MNISIVKYNAGNIRSVTFALERLGITPVLTDDPEQLRKADKVIFPGVGEASSTMRALSATGLDTIIPTLEQPVLGICLGMQLMCTHSDEGNTRGLGIFAERVERFPPGDLKVPHMGWNRLQDLRGPLFAGLDADSFVYFVHSYYVPQTDATIAAAQYGKPFSAAMQRDNFYATQFHPEKSGPVGAKILENFIKL